MIRNCLLLSEVKVSINFVFFREKNLRYGVIPFEDNEEAEEGGHVKTLQVI